MSSLSCAVVTIRSAFSYRTRLRKYARSGFLLGGAWTILKDDDDENNNLRMMMILVLRVLFQDQCAIEMVMKR
jgi:hypothetical protein